MCSCGMNPVVHSTSRGRPFTTRSSESQHATHLLFQRTMVTFERSLQNLQTQHIPIGEEFNGPKVLRKKICGIVIPINEEDINKSTRNGFADVMIADVDVFGTLLSNGVGGDKYRALIISAKGDWFEVIA